MARRKKERKSEKRKLPASGSKKRKPSPQRAWLACGSGVARQREGGGRAWKRSMTVMNDVVVPSVAIIEEGRVAGDVRYSAASLRKS